MVVRTHQSTEALESSRYSDMRVDLDENTFGGVDVHLKQACLVERRIEQSEETLYHLAIRNRKLVRAFAFAPDA